MLSYLIVGLSAFVASLLTFYSGFGFATLLMPVLAIFLPLPVSIGVTAIVHLFHNILKTVFLAKFIDWYLAFKFGAVALIASIPGALVLKRLSTIPPSASYVLFSHSIEISALKIAIGISLILIAFLQVIPKKPIQIANLFLGAILTGFFGGLSGNQGAFRSAFLIQTSLNKKAFIGTNALIAIIVDLTRLIVYTLTFADMMKGLDKGFLGIAGGASLLGIGVGMVFLDSITIEKIHQLVIGLLVAFGSLMILGIV